MIRSKKGNFVFDFACWKYPTTFEKVVFCRKEVAVKCLVCDKIFNFKSCKDVDGHTGHPEHVELELVSFVQPYKQHD